MIYFIDDDDERLSLTITYWSYVIAFQDYQEECNDIEEESINEFLNWVIINQEKLKQYDIFNM